MNRHDETCTACAVVGGLLGAIIIASVFFKWMKNFWMELGQSFSAFGEMTGSFIWMLWNVFQVVSLIAMIITAVTCAIYFSIKYYEMVKESTELQKWTQDAISQHDAKMKARSEDLLEAVNCQVQQLNQRLTEALTKPEVAPPAQSVSVDERPSMTEPTPEKLASTTDVSLQNSDQVETITMSNPL